MRPCGCWHSSHSIYFLAEDIRLSDSNNCAHTISDFEDAKALYIYSTINHYTRIGCNGFAHTKTHRIKPQWRLREAREGTGGKGTSTGDLRITTTDAPGPTTGARREPPEATFTTSYYGVTNRTGDRSSDIAPYACPAMASFVANGEAGDK